MRRSAIPWLLVVTSCAGCRSAQTLLEGIEALERRYPSSRIAVAYRPLLRGSGAPHALEVWWRAHEVMHAASTMKVAVMIEVYAQAAAGDLDLDGSIVLQNRFASIVDGSEFAVAASDDSEQSLYARVGQPVPIRELVRAMIAESSNLATNALVERVGATSIQARIRDLGTTRMEVHRGVEDQKAFEHGLNNTATAHDLMVLLAAIATGQAVDAGAAAEMLEVLAMQRFNEAIPAGLPGDCRVAHKTGWITGIRHDAAIVLTPAPPCYVLAVLTEGLPAMDANAVIASVARLVHRHHLASFPSRGR